ncbi:pectinesterase [Phlyctema vagabunda]|uniref:Pectinesterase n=1 Tax=Phlyctema vagabunda TaxID=108571 RepID=A0ABR4PIE4_9HELO
MYLSTSLSLASIATSLAAAATLNVGANQTYQTITAALDAASSGDQVYVFPGIYNEKIVINKTGITLKGSAYPSLDPRDNEAEINFATYASAVGSNDRSATLLVRGDDFSMYNINVTNSAGNVSQAVALSMTGFRGGLYATALKGWQDTFYSHSGSQFLSSSYIEGAVDFIFGIDAQSWYQGCTLGALKAAGIVTAQGRTALNSTGYFVMNQNKIILGEGVAQSVAGTFLLGRPWRDFARTVFQNSDLGSIIAPVGWQAWNDAQDTSAVFYGEYNNTNANDDGSRLDWIKKLDAPIELSTILPGYESWVDAAYLGLPAL